MVNYVPHYARLGKEVESNHALMDAMKVAYAYITTTRHFKNLTFTNVLLYVVVSTSANTNQMHIAKTIGAFRYFIWKVINIKIHGDQRSDNFWGGLPRKCWCDVINVEDWELILKWWETSITISPIQKDMKHWRIGVKKFDNVWNTK